MDEANLNALIQKIPADHPLRTAGADYRNGFVQAYLAVYGHLADRNSAAVLKRKFLVSGDSQFQQDTYLQGASELAVANHIRRQHVTGFETDKKVNPQNQKDADVFCITNAVRVSSEVKCAVEETAAEQHELILRTDGRIPQHTQTHADLRAQIVAKHPNLDLKMGKNKDNTLKTFLLEANDKFNPGSGVDDLNILFVACEDHGNLNEWYRYLYGGKGLFTADSFHPTREFRNVDVVILSNLKYRHKTVRSCGDWTLDNTFLIPFINPHGRPTATRDSIANGLRLFDHHLRRFLDYEQETEDPEVPKDVVEATKVIHYVAERLSEAERTKYFPTITKWRAD